MNMKNGTEWRAYTDMAWTETILTSPDEYAEETRLLVNTIKEHSKIEVKTLLHLGCGAGGNDYTFKRHYQVTGVDISEKMLEIARDPNPEERDVQHENSLSNGESKTAFARHAGQTPDGPHRREHRELAFRSPHASQDPAGAARRRKGPGCPQLQLGGIRYALRASANHGHSG